VCPGGCPENRVAGGGTPKFGFPRGPEKSGGQIFTNFEKKVKTGGPGGVKFVKKTRFLMVQNCSLFEKNVSRNTDNVRGFQNTGIVGVLLKNGLLRALFFTFFRKKRRI